MSFQMAIEPTPDQMADWARGSAPDPLPTGWAAMIARIENGREAFQRDAMPQEFTVAADGDLTYGPTQRRLDLASLNGELVTADPDLIHAARQHPAVEAS